MNFPVRAITLDLDDTLWPFAPYRRAHRAGAACLAARAQPADRRALADRGDARAARTHGRSEHPHLAHDLTEQRRLIPVARAAREPATTRRMPKAAYDVFFDARNQVECYADSIAALQRLAARVPVAALTNGNADLQRIGLAPHFTFVLGAREHGTPKPSPCIFHAACERLRLAPGEVLHVGDDIETGHRRRRAGRPAHVLDQSRRRALAARRRATRPRIRHPRRAGRLARCARADTIAPDATARPCPHESRAPRRASTRPTRAFAIGDAALRCIRCICPSRRLAAWRERQPPATVQWLLSHGYDAAPGSMLALPGGDGTLAGAVLGIGDPLDPFAYAHAPYALPAGDWQLCRRRSTTPRAMRSSSAGAWAPIASRAIAMRRARRHGWRWTRSTTRPATSSPPACACAI